MWSATPSAILPGMEKHDLLAAISADSAATAEAARRGVDPTVPACPDWTVAQLIEHLGRVHRSVTRRVRDRETERHRASDIPLPDRSGLIAWFEEGAATLIDVLAGAEADTPVWNWSLGEQQASFWWQRMAQETAVHRWDAQSAHGRTVPIQADLAVDGVDEFLTVFLPIDLADRPDFDLGGAVDLRCTDRPERRLVTVTGGQLRVHANQSPAPDYPMLGTVAGSASDLLLLLWRRMAPSAPAFTVSGDPALVERFLTFADLA